MVWSLEEHVKVVPRLSNRTVSSGRFSGRNRCSSMKKMFSVRMNERCNPSGLFLTSHRVTVQDVVRVTSKLRRLQWQQLCMHFDWMDGSSAHVPATQLTLLLKLVVTCTCIAAIESQTCSARQIGFTSVAAVMFTAWVTLQV
jgi:hypothetical protein